ncbi:hypothetical protein T492DRAFT_304755 [Pavlovales sp. CCMP2436]|nr:hypothetical protein T492DRAFT_304755 [Pavlovales sp. CCMP2436]
MLCWSERCVAHCLLRVLVGCAGLGATARADGSPIVCPGKGGYKIQGWFRLAAWRRPDIIILPLAIYISLVSQFVRHVWGPSGRPRRL